MTREDDKNDEKKPSDAFDSADIFGAKPSTFEEFDSELTKKRSVRAEAEIASNFQEETPENPSTSQFAAPRDSAVLPTVEISENSPPETRRMGIFDNARENVADAPSEDATREPIDVESVEKIPSDGTSESAPPTSDESQRKKGGVLRETPACCCCLFVIVGYLIFWGFFLLGLLSVPFGQ